MKNSDKSILRISLENVRNNYEALRKAVSKKVSVAPVLKYNAYGLGAKEIAQELAGLGAEEFYVFNYDEAQNLKDCKGVNKVYILDGISKSNAKKIRDEKLIPVLSSHEQIEEWSQFENAPYALMIDTGMNRTGLNFEEGLEFLRSGKMHNPEYVLSHLSCAEVKDSEHNKKQLEQVKKIREEFPGIKISLANSAGIFLGNEYHFNQVRPGIGIYGGEKSNYPAEIKNVVFLAAKVKNIREINTNEYVGYNASYKAKKGNKIATLQIGYADGYPRNLSNVSKVYYKGIEIPVVGKVSMDYITVDVSGIDSKSLEDMTHIEVINDRTCIDKLGKCAGILSYEVLTGLASGRFEKVFE